MNDNAIEVSARTVDMAVEAALQKLGLARGDAEITVLDEGQRGILGLGSREASVRVCAKDTSERRAADFIRGVTSRMQMKADVAARDSEDALCVDIEGDDMGALIGHHGETLDALQYLTSLVVNRGRDAYHRVLLDTEGYREKRAEALRQLAERTASRAVRIGRVALEPMNPYERRILHTALQDNPRVTTYSEGEEPYRRVIIVRK